MSSNMALISIIVPAYNIAPYLPRCLDSLIAQSYSALEIIVVNDGSTDGTASIIHEYAAKDHRIIAIHKENGGVSSARLAGIAASSGDWIGFVDGDDYAEPEMFAHLLKNALEHNVDISHCGYQMVFPDGHIDMYYNTGRAENLSREEGLKALLKGDYLEPGLWNKLYRRGNVIGFEHSSLWDRSIRINEDVLMNYILFSRAECTFYEDIPYYHYMLRKGSAATSQQPRRFKTMDPLRVMEAVLAHASGNSAIYPYAAERYLRVLIGVAQQQDWPEDAAAAKNKLKQRLWEFRGLGIHRKVYVMAFGVAYLQQVYKLVRSVYNRITGIDKKYDLE